MKQLGLAFGALAVVLAPGALLAQDADEPDTNVITISKFHVPAGEDRAKVMEFIDRVIVPTNQVNPNVLSYRVAVHFYGAHSTEIALIAEYPDWNAVEAPCGTPCEEWAEANWPAEGTPEYDEMAELQAAWTKAYMGGHGHSDEIYNVRMDRAKN